MTINFRDTFRVTNGNRVRGGEKVMVRLDNIRFTHKVGRRSVHVLVVYLLGGMCPE